PPPPPPRLAMLEEAVQVMRLLLTGDEVSHHGTHYTVENARLYTVPDEPVPIDVSGFGPAATELAGRIGDGYVTMAPDADSVARFRRAGGGPKTARGGLKVCWGRDREQAIDTAHRLWSTEQLPGELPQVLPTPSHFEQATTLVPRERIARNVPCGDDPDSHVAAISAFVDAGFDAVYVNQIGKDQREFFDFYRSSVLPVLPS
ncbi:TIGR03557 family F420-dependent LLM class oxidoreductase, partial [Streptomyces sp. 796.1]|uniref:TIGR03557 family F420-dependent LLM class oxidoreductase n=1 Tax=Streptomyces sp. 796.1 TaxID=3163029 RepID=UPI0039C9155B